MLTTSRQFRIPIVRLYDPKQDNSDENVDAFNFSSKGQINEYLSKAD